MARILNFIQTLQKNIIFSKRDIKKAFPDIYPARLTEWQKAGYLKKITNNFYISSDLVINEQVLFLISNKIYDPSYVSLETALSYYGLVPEQVFNVTCISTNRIKTFKTVLGNFIFKRLPPELYFGYKTIKCGQLNFKIADKEKTILDYFYQHRHLKTKADFESVRLNREELQNTLDKQKLEQYLTKYRSKTFIRTINKLIKYIYHD